jgi:hypothetical protein
VTRRAARAIPAATPTSRAASTHESLCRAGIAAGWRCGSAQLGGRVWRPADQLTPRQRVRGERRAAGRRSGPRSAQRSRLPTHPAASRACAFVSPGAAPSASAALRDQADASCRATCSCGRVRVGRRQTGRATRMVSDGGANRASGASGSCLRGTRASTRSGARHELARPDLRALRRGYALTASRVVCAGRCDDRE